MLKLQLAYFFINSASVVLYSRINDFIDCLCMSFSGVILYVLISLRRALRNSLSKIIAKDRRSFFIAKSNLLIAESIAYLRAYRDGAPMWSASVTLLPRLYAWINSSLYMLL